MKKRNNRGTANRGLLVIVSIVVVVLLALALWGILGHFSKPANESAPNTVAEQPKLMAPAAPAVPVAAAPTVTPAPAPAAASTPDAAAADEKLVVQDSPATKGKTMDLLVIDGISKEPIPGAQILTAGVPVKERFKGTTELDGHAKVPVPEKATAAFNIGVHPKGYVYMRLYWNRGGMAKEDIPATYTIEVERAVRVRGKVVDEEGNPVSGASVLLAVKKSYSNPHESLDVGGGAGIRTIKAADSGIFSYTGIPEKVDSLEIGAWDYKHVVDMSTKPIEESKLKDGTAVVVLKKGVVVEGQVVDAKGTPLLEGTVTLSNDQDTQAQLPPQKLDEQGKFAYAFPAGQSATLNITSTGYVPLSKEITAGSQDQQITVQLALGHKFTGQILDPSGKGVPNAYIYGIHWEGGATNTNIRSDPDGSFIWTEAPAGEFSYSISANGFRQLDNQKATASDKPVIIKLKAGQHIHGTVVDAETGKPVEGFRIALGIKWSEQQGIAWQQGMRTNEMVAKPGGVLDFNLNWSYPEFAIRVEANGHYPVESRVFKSTEDDVQLDLKMKPGKDLIATIVDADGKPVVGAKAVMANADGRVYIRADGDILEGNQSVVSDEKGEVHFSPQSGDYKIAAFTNDGFAEVAKDDAVESPKLVLQPWGRVEGVLMIGPNPAPGQQLELMTNENNTYMYDVRTPSLMVEGSTKTDATGHFVFERVPAVAVTLNRLITMGRYNQQYFRVAAVDVKAGETAKITAGGTGRPVTGKVILPDAVAKKADTSFGYSNATVDVGGFAGPPMPEEVEKGTQEQRTKWFAEFIKTKPGKAYLKVINDLNHKRHDYPILVNKDGTFRIDDVVPGHYQVQINIVRTTRNNGEQYIGVARGEFTVSPMEGGRSDEALVVPDLKAEMNAGMQ